MLKLVLIFQIKAMSSSNTASFGVTFQHWLRRKDHTYWITGVPFEVTSPNIGCLIPVIQKDPSWLQLTGNILSISLLTLQTSPLNILTGTRKDQK